MKINEKSDCSYLFQNLSNSNTSSLANINISDYTSIKNGSYGKLLKAYYAKKTNTSDDGTSSTTKNDKTSKVVKELSEISSDAASLQKSASKLIEKGSNSLFKEKEMETTNSDGSTVTQMGYDKDTIFENVNDFIKDYNSFIADASDVSSTMITKETQNLVNFVSNISGSLSKVGITINDDNTLLIDENKFKSSDMTKVKSLFNGNQSFTYSVATKASLISASATSEINKTKNYTSTGSYSDTYSSGNLLNSII